MISQEIINRGGGKLEVTRAIIERGLTDILPVPRSIWHYAGEDLGLLKSEFEKMQKPVIVRPSTSRDLEDEVGVYCSPHVDSWDKFERAIKEAEAFYAGESMRLFCKDLEIPHDHRVNFLIQEFKNSTLGTMVQNPHTGIIRLEYRTGEDYLLNREREFNPDGTPIEEPSHWYGGVFREDKTTQDQKQARDLFLAFIASGILDPSYAFALEVGMEPKFFLQARLFKRKQPAETWQLPLVDEETPHIKGRECFGITPPEGVVYQTFQNSIPAETIEHRKPYALIKNNCYGSYYILRDNVHQEAQNSSPLGNLQVYKGESVYWLNHSNYRLVRKAKISDISTIVYRPNRDKFRFNCFMRYFCNGSEFLAVQEN